MGQFWTWQRHPGPCGSIAALFSDSIFSPSSVWAAAVFVFWDLANLLTNYEYYSCSNEVRKLSRRPSPTFGPPAVRVSALGIP